jgi:phenylpyruvate tautomerase PptA (4-oxalocrotonate tautomerase family)
MEKRIRLPGANVGFSASHNGRLLLRARARMKRKAKLIDAVTDAFGVLDIKKKHVIIVIHEAPRSNWGLGGLHK